MMQDNHPQSGLNAWLERIRDQELPIFGRTAEQIRALTDSDKAAVSQLADAILCDPGMTAKLLRIANSVIFNTSGPQITTVSRAVVMLGFDMVRQVALSVAFVDALLRGPVRERAHQPEEDLAAAVMKNASEAAAIADCYGAGAAIRFIPQ